MGELLVWWMVILYGLIAKKSKNRQELILKKRSAELQEWSFLLRIFPNHYKRNKIIFRQAILIKVSVCLQRMIAIFPSLPWFYSRIYIKQYVRLVSDSYPFHHWSFFCGIVWWRYTIQFTEPVIWILTQYSTELAIPSLPNTVTDLGSSTSDSCWIPGTEQE